MSQDVHTVEVVGGSTVASQDRITAAFFPIQAVPASANAVTVLGTITPGSGYVLPPILTASGGTGSGLTAVGLTLKAVSATPVSGGTSGFAVNDTITLSNGVVLTVATVSAGVVQTANVTTAGSFTAGTTNPVSQTATSGSGVGTTTWNVNYGLATAQITNSGSYTGAPSMSTAPDPRNGATGSGAAIGACTLGGNGNAVVVGVLAQLPPVYSVMAESSMPAFTSVPYKSTAGFSVALTPVTTGGTIAAGTADLVAIG